MKKLLVLIFLIGGLYWWWLPNTVKGPASGHEFEYIIQTSGNGGSSDLLPMVIAMHGNGDTPDNFFDTLLKDFEYPARFIMVRGPMDYAGASWGGRAWPMDNHSLREYGDALADAVPILMDMYPTEGKPIVLGFSGGAYFAYYLASFHADRFSYIFPLSGGLPGELMKANSISYDSGAKVIAFHGKSDQVIGFRQAEAAVRHLRKRGLNAQLITHDGGHLDIFRSVNGNLLDQLGNVIIRITR